MTNTIYTIGYESCNINDFIATLKENESHVLFDVREMPYSQNPDFCAVKLMGHLFDNDIVYQGMPSLGMPKEGRYRAKINQHDTAWRIYREQVLDSDSFEEKIKWIKAFIEIGTNKPTFMCYEKEHKYCHRNLLVEKIAEYTDGGLDIIHLKVNKNAKV